MFALPLLVTQSRKRTLNNHAVANNRLLGAQSGLSRDAAHPWKSSGNRSAGADD